MLHRVAVIGSLLLGLACFASAQFDPSATRGLDASTAVRPATINEHAASAVISGVVRSHDNRGISNARVELRDLSGMVVASTYTGPTGTFQVNNLVTGRYEVVATVGLSEAHEQMTLDRGDNTVTLRVNDATPMADAGNANSVSVADMRVPDKARKALNKARELLAKHRTADAQKELAKALEICPQYSEALRERGIMAFVAGNREQAKADLAQAIKYDPNNGMAYIALGAALNNEEKYNDAMRELDRGVALSPSSWQAYFELARTNLGQGDFATALRNTEKAQQFLKEDYPALHLVRAHALLGLKNYSEAQNELEAYISREPDANNAASVQKTLDEVKAFTARAGSGK